MSSEPTTVQSDLSELIAENFGANATYAETLLARFRSDPSLVDESWQAYFEELIGGNGEAANDTKTESTPPKRTSTSDGDGVAAKATTSAPTKPQPAATIEAGAEAIPIRGAALRIVENM